VRGEKDVVNKGGAARPKKVYLIAP